MSARLDQIERTAHRVRPTDVGEWKLATGKAGAADAVVIAPADLRWLIDVARAASIEKDRMRGTGGNRFIAADATSADLLRSINDQLGDLREWAAGDGRVLDLAEITISTQRVRSGRISVSVTADLAEAGGASDV